MRQFDPERTHQELRPARVNAKALFTLGTIAWLVGLAALGVAHVAGANVPGGYALICIAGIVLGFAGFWWAHKMHLIDDSGMSE